MSTPRQRAIDAIDRLAMRCDLRDCVADVLDALEAAGLRIIDAEDHDDLADLDAKTVEEITETMSNADRAAFIRKALRAGADIPEVCEADCREPVTEHDIEGIPLCAGCFAACEPLDEEGL